MNEKRKDLYIPVKTLDSEDYIAGIGNLEVMLIAGGTVAAIFIGIVVANMTQTIVGLGTGVLMIVLVIGLVRRDSVNENLIQKLLMVYRYLKIPKQYQYQYFNVLESMNIENLQTDEGEAA